MGKFISPPSLALAPLKLIWYKFECGHFKKANEWLGDRYGEDGEIDWSLNAEPAKKAEPV
jgi:hypothetical protein